MMTPCLPMNSAKCLKTKIFRSTRPNAAEAAMKWANIYDYQAIFLNLGLPDMTGSDVSNELRKNGDETPVIILSGQTEIEARLTYLNLGTNYFLIKPLHSKELVA